MIYSNISQLTGTLHVMELPITEEEFALAYEAWANGMVLQEAFSTLNADEREFVKTGITPDEWEEMFGGEE